MKIRAFRALYPDLDYVTSSDSFFRGIKEAYPEYYRSGLFEKQAEEGLYIYRIRYADHAFIGLVALADIGDYRAGRIKKHENTLADKEQIHLNLLLRNQAVVKPVVLTHNPVPALAGLLRQYSQGEPDFTLHFDGENIDHSWWMIRDPAFHAEVVSLFAREVKESYIADGHHRSSAVNLLFERRQEKDAEAECSGLLAAFFAADQVEILDFNRIVDIFGEMSPTLFMARLSTVMEIEERSEPCKPQGKHELTMYLHKEWYSLCWKPDILARYQHQSVVLDAQLFNEEILSHLMEVRDIRTDGRISYFPGVYGLDAFRHAVNEKEIRVGFCLPPVTLAEMMTLSDEGGVLPPKSTWFQPRMKNGVIIHEF